MKNKAFSVALCGVLAVTMLAPMSVAASSSTAEAPSTGVSLRLVNGKIEVDKALKELKDDGTIDKIVSKYIK